MSPRCSRPLSLLVRSAFFASAAAVSLLACSSSGGSGTSLYCSSMLAGAQQCYGYTGLTADQESAEQTACAGTSGTIVDACPTGYVGCCATTTGGFTTSQCFYAGTAAELSAQCVGSWTGAGATGSGSSGVVTHPSTSGVVTNPFGGSSGAVITGGTLSTSGGGGGGPVIESLTVNPMVVTPGTPVIVSAIVGDPLGLSNLVGGTLIDLASGATYGAFVTPGGQGTFTFSLTWTELNAVAKADFAAGGNAKRSVTAKFFDNSGHSIEQSVNVTAQCDSAAEPSCGGTCTDTTTDKNNCGGCGKVCKSDVPASFHYGEGQYTSASCVQSVCQTSQLSTHAMSCNAVCAAVGTQCLQENEYCGPVFFYGPETSGMYMTADDFESCTSVPAATDSGQAFDAELCCCGSMP